VEDKGACPLYLKPGFQSEILLKPEILRRSQQVIHEAPGLEIEEMHGVGPKGRLTHLLESRIINPSPHVS
jgi:hypothetical protein